MQELDDLIRRADEQRKHCKLQREHARLSRQHTLLQREFLQMERKEAQRLRTNLLEQGKHTQQLRVRLEQKPAIFNSHYFFPPEPGEKDYAEKAGNNGGAPEADSATNSGA